MSKDLKLSKETAYIKLSQSSGLMVGITHHETGLGKLKINYKGTEYGIPVSDINSKPLSEWRIDKG